MNILNNNISRLRVAGFLEGLSLIVLMGFAMPMKYIWGDPSFVRMIGSVHGALFILFAVQLYLTAEEKNWSYKDLPLKLMISCFIPFGTFYLDHKILKGMDEN
jgi:integral membrane protein